MRRKFTKKEQEIVLEFLENFKEVSSEYYAYEQEFKLCVIINAMIEQLKYNLECGKYE